MTIASENRPATGTPDGFTLVLDPGHFNIDAAGKVTRDGTSAKWRDPATGQTQTVLEAEVTLDVSEMLRKELEGGGAAVHATRWLDPTLGEEDPANHKYWRIAGKGYDAERANIGRAEFANEKILGADWRELVAGQGGGGKEQEGGDANGRGDASAIGGGDGNSGGRNAPSTIELANGLFLRIHFDGSENAGDRGFNVYYNDQSDYDKDGRIAAESKRWAEKIAATLADGVRNPDGSWRRHPWPIPPNGPDNGVRRFERPIYGFKHAAVPSVLIEGGFFTNPKDLAVIMDPSCRLLLARLLAEAIME
ncbi:MAG: N-acetylmuramoyl-L-alanine amidase [bacterium]|jgi:N-acetylmuramoyl-L-alanine amidase